MSNDDERPGDPHLSVAQRVMHARTGMAFAVASRDGTAGQFRVFDEGGPPVCSPPPAASAS